MVILMFFLAFSTSAIFSAQAEQGLEDTYLRGERRTGGVVVVTHVHPVPQNGGNGGPQHYVGINIFSKGRPLELGTIQIILGLMFLMFGIVMALHGDTMGVFSGIFVWGALMYITAGGLTVAAGKHLTRCLVAGGVVVVVTHVHPVPQNGENGGPQHYVGINMFSKGRPLELGTIQIMVGLMFLMFGIVMAIHGDTMGVLSGIFVWGALMYITAGGLTVAAGKHLTRCLVGVFQYSRVQLLSKPIPYK
ncbi:hypothetical protein INR49_031965 [Caranx melampygus]|nr:hypothetical protein INR49_031965 [Caranx melampygus]